MEDKNDLLELSGDQKVLIVDENNFSAKIKLFFSELIMLFKTNTGHMVFVIFFTFILACLLSVPSGQESDSFGDSKTTSNISHSASNGRAEEPTTTTVEALITTTTTTTATSPATTTTTVPPIKKYYDGMYKIGTDMPAGEYVIITNRSCYIEVSSDSSGSFDSIITNDNFINRNYITVKNGQYLEFSSGYAVAAVDATPATIDSTGYLPEGMYKVGVDIAPGEYKIFATGGSGYVEISSKSSGLLDDIITNDNFSGEKYITVSNGHYIKLSNAKIKIR